MVRRGEWKAVRTLAAFFAASLFAYQPVAWTAVASVVGIVSVRGSAEINGIRAVTGGSVFAGDRIVTREDSNAAITSRGGARLLVLDASAVQIKDAGEPLTAVLDRGSVAAVSPAQAPLVVEVRGMRILPAPTGTVYAVVFEGNKLKVLAQSGALSVEAAGRTISVPEGKTLNADVVPPAANGAGGAGAAGGGSALTGILIASTVALAAATLALAIDNATKGCTVSPAGVGTCSVH